MIALIVVSPAKCILSELQALSAVSFAYIIWAHSIFSFNTNAVSEVPVSTAAPTPVALGRPDNRRPISPVLLAAKRDFGFVWMSVPKNYR